MSSERGREQDSGIRRTDLEYEQRQPASEDQGAADANNETDRQYQSGLPQHSHAHLSGGRPERHPDPDLLRPLAHRVGEHAVEAQRGEHQRHPREGTHQDERESLDG